MAQHQKPLESPLAFHALETEQGSQGLASSWTCKNQHILFQGIALLKPTAEQVDELLLPLPGLNGRQPSGDWQIK